MQYLRINRKDPKVRTALLKAHNGKCFYTDRPLNYEEMEIDHLIPERLGSSPDLLKKYLSELDLPSDFSLDCFHNLVPTGRKPNERKSDHVFPEKEVRFYLNLTHKQFPKFEKELKAAEARASRSDLRQLIDLLTDESPYYEESIKISSNWCTLSKKHVRLWACLPDYPFSPGSCLITFKSVMLRDCMIDFDHKSIMSNLIAGAHSASAFDLRGFFVGSHREKHFVQLGNNRFALTQEELEELCWAVDEFEEVYVRRLDELERAFETASFNSSSKRENGFQLIKISRDLWNLLLRFSSHFDAWSGDSKWHIFDHNPNLLKIYGGRGNPNIPPGYRAMIFPEYVDEWEGQSFRFTNNTLRLSWVPIKGLGTGSLSDYSPEGLWGAETTYNWLTEELIPYVVFYFQKKKKNWWALSSEKADYRKFLKEFDPSLYFTSDRRATSVDINSTCTLEECIRLTRSLQSHFSVGRQVYLQAIAMKCLYGCLIDLLKQDPLDCYGYVAGNLSSNVSCDCDEIIRELDKCREEFLDGSYSSSQLDYPLRSVIEILENGKFSFSRDTAASISNDLKHLWFLKEREEKMWRMSDGWF